MAQGRVGITFRESLLKNDCWKTPCLDGTLCLSHPCKLFYRGKGIQSQVKMKPFQVKQDIGVGSEMRVRLMEEL